MVAVRQIINDFLSCYISNNLNRASCVDDAVTAQYSNLGVFNSKDEMIRGLTWNDQYDIARVTTTNYMEYQEGNAIVAALVAHHLVSYEKNNEMFPFVFGGKYVFTINSESLKIRKIQFVLEYQAENTIYVKGLWKLSDGKNDYSIISNFDPDTFLKKDDLSVKDIVNLFFWCLDTKDLKTLDGLCADSFFISRDQSVGNKKFESDKSGLAVFIEETDSYYDMNQNSIRINSFENTDHGLTVYAQRLTPHRLGTKKLNSMTKYHSFFDEDITIHMNDDHKISEVVMKKAADVFYNGTVVLDY